MSQLVPFWSLRERIRNGEIGVEDLVLECIERVEEDEGLLLNAFITVCKKEALSQARDIDGRIRRGEKVGRLVGAPMAVKDNICTKGVRTTCGSRILENFVPPYDAEIIRRIRAEDGVILGKTNMDEFAMGSSTELSAFGPSRNPIDERLVPGGSSGGSAVALASGQCYLALGADTGGSIRCPAAFCGVVGLKPTYGLVSRFGLIAYANSLEQIGPMARDVLDTAILLESIAGRDPKDNTTIAKGVPGYEALLKQGIKGLRGGIIKELVGEGVREEVRKSFWEAVDLTRSLGIPCEEVSLPSLEYALPCYYLIAMSEASSNLARYDGLRYGLAGGENERDWRSSFKRVRREGFGPEVKRRIILGTFALSAGYYEQYYLKAQRVRTLIIRDFALALRSHDFLLSPSMPLLPYKIGEKVKDPLELYATDLETVSVNLAGLPAISIPSQEVNGLPAGLQIIGPHFREDLILRVAYAYENEKKKKSRTP